MKNMANASGMACRDYTPPGGETFDQVSESFERIWQVPIFFFYCVMPPSSGRSGYRSLQKIFSVLKYRFLFFYDFIQVKLRFKKFLNVLFSRMVEEHGWSAPDSPEGAVEAEEELHSGLAEDGLNRVSVHALAVSHGTYMCAAAKHLLEDSSCSIPAGAKVSRLTAPVPNTGISRFIFTLKKCESGPQLADVRCVFTNRKDHLETLKAAEH